MKPKILVIDDEHSVRKLISEILQYAGYEVCQAGGGREGVVKAGEVLPDLVLCDVCMPDLDGFATLAAIRQQAGTATTPFIFLTGRVERRDVRQGMASGADDYLTKPFNATELIEAVRARLARQSELQKHSEQRLADLRGNIVHMLPHELRTPLQGILGFAEIMLDEHETMPRQQVGEMARHILESAQRLHRVVENFLVYAQIQVYARDERKCADLLAQTTPIGQALVEELLQAKPALAARRADITVWLKDATVHSSRDDLAKIVDELVDNAVKFSAPGTPVQITGWLEEREYLLTIQDYGRGMTPEQLAAIGAYAQFDRQFYEQQGTGLGLTIARDLLRLHGGSLSLDSRPNEYTKAELHLRLATGA